MLPVHNVKVDRVRNLRTDRQAYHSILKPFGGMGTTEEWFENFDEDCSQSDEEWDQQHSGGTLPCNNEEGFGVGEVDPVERLDVEYNTTQRYRVIGADELRRLQLSAMEQVAGILGCSIADARAMLTAYYWDAETLLNMVGERGIDKVKERCGLVGTANLVLEQHAEIDTEGLPGDSLGKEESTDQPVCQVCFSSSHGLISMNTSCSASNHKFCKDCWKGYVVINIAEGKSRGLRCMAPKCSLLCDENQIRSLISDHIGVIGDVPSMLEKYEQSLLEGFVQDNKRVRWCPSIPHCGRAVIVTSDDCHCEVECPCGEFYCFSCGKPPHSPATCTMIEQWQQRIQDGTPSNDWVNAHTKQCPTCGNSIEKNGGCNLMQCRCGATFCWLCGQKTGREHDYHQIRGHSCGAFVEDAKQRSDIGERNLKRFLHFYTRYEAHLNSSRLEEQLRRLLDQKIACIMKTSSGSDLPNCVWLHDAFEQLCLARKIMSFSYVFAYFIFGLHAAFLSSTVPVLSMQALFEDKQGQLEIEVERLANILEKTPATKMLEERFTVINLTSGINSRIIKMYEVIENDIVPQSAGLAMRVAPYKGQATKMTPNQSIATSFMVEEGDDAHRVAVKRSRQL